jgi:hypothetical protein
MIRRLVALTLKEAREHAFVLLALLVSLPFGWGLFVLAAFGAPTTVTYLEAHVSFMRFVWLFAALALGNRLVVAELHGRTQRFLESLPMRRGEPFVVKWMFGLVVLLAIAFGSLVGTALVAMLREPIDVPFLAILSARTFFFSLCAWTFFFTMGLFGKARVPLYLLFVLGLILIASTTELELVRFGPFALMGPEAPLERRAMPWEPIGVSLALTAFFLVAGAVITMLREGSVQERLSQRMSQRDLAMMGISVMGLLTVWGTLEGEAEPLPYVMSGEHVMLSESLPIAIGYGDDASEPDARALMTRLEADVAEVRAALAADRLPQMRVVLRRSLDGRYVEPVRLALDDGMLVRANFRSDVHPDLDTLSAEVIAGMLDARTRRRSLFEPRRWMRDGLSLWTASPRVSQAGHELTATRLAQAAWATRTRGPDASRIDHFELLRETQSSRVAMSLAATGWATIADATHDGGAAVAREVFPVGATDDVRTVLREWWSPPSAQLERVLGSWRSDLEEAWRERLRVARARPDVQAILARLPEAEATITTERDASGIVLVVVRAHVRGSTEGLALSVRHLSIGPFDRTIEDVDMQLESRIFDDAGNAEVRLAGRYAVSDRVLVRVDLEGTALDAPMRLAVQRMEIR